MTSNLNDNFLMYPPMPLFVQEIDEIDKLKETSDSSNERPQAEGSTKVPETEPAPLQMTPTSPTETTPASFPVCESQAVGEEAQISAPSSNTAVLDDRPETIGESSPSQFLNETKQEDGKESTVDKSSTGVVEERTPGDGEGGESNQEMVIGILNSIVDTVVQGWFFCALM